MHIYFRFLLKHHHSHFCITRVERFAEPRTSWPRRYQAEYRKGWSLYTFHNLDIVICLLAITPNTKQLTGMMTNKLLRKSWGEGGERQAKPSGQQALHNPTVASKAVLTGTRSNNTTSVSHRTPIQHIPKPQRWALYSQR